MQCKALVVQVWVIHLLGETADEPVTAQKYGSENGVSRFHREGTGITGRGGKGADRTGTDCKGAGRTGTGGSG
jgi:hypothetical protein